jgi:hypothetical protein
LDALASLQDTYVFKRRLDVWRMRQTFFGLQPGVSHYNVSVTIEMQAARRWRRIIAEEMSYAPCKGRRETVDSACEP